jgi:Flp pilus assembly protein TadG
MYSSNTNGPLWRDDSGAGTAWWILWMIVFMVFGGVAVDSANAWRMRAELQATADAAALAAVVDLPNATAARASANSFATKNMSEEEHGDVLATAEIEIGVWNSAAGKYQPLPDVAHPVKDAVRVTTRRDATNANQLKTYFLRLVGMDDWDVNAQAVAQRYFPKCTNTDGLFARHVVDMQSNNILKDGICIHGNDHVEVNNGNNWEAGVSVTMPSLSDLQIPNSDIDTLNPGQKRALGEEWFDVKIVDQIGDIVASIKAGESTYLPSYIGVDSSGDTIPAEDLVVSISAAQFNAATAEKGYIYDLTCPGNSLLVLGPSSIEVSKMAIIANCRIYTGQGAYLHDVILASTRGDVEDNQLYPKAINIGQSAQLGADDGCATSGNVKLFATGGSIRSAADIEAYGLQAVAVRDIQFTAQAKGLEGILLQAGNDVSITSNNSFGSTCPNLDAIQVTEGRATSGSLTQGRNRAGPASTKDTETEGYPSGRMESLLSRRHARRRRGPARRRSPHASFPPGPASAPPVGGAENLRLTG